MWGTKLPKKAGGKYLVTINNTVRQAVYVEYPEGNFYWIILPECASHTTAVVAWQKEPAPYKGK